MHLDRDPRLIIVPRPSNGGTATFTPAQDCVRRVATMRTRLEASGIPIPAGSRFESLERRTRRFASGELRADSPDRVEVVALGEGARLLTELEILADALLPTSDPLVRDKFRSILGGNVLPSQDRGKARSTLIELMVAARLRERGAHVAFQETPDMIVTLRGHRYGLEVKRLSSVKNVKARFAEARHQIEAAGLPGIVAFDADRLLLVDHPGATEVSLQVPPGIQPAELQWIARHAYFKHLHHEVTRYAKPPIVAVITSVIIRTETPAANTLGTALGYHVHPIADADEADLRPLAEFFGAGDRIRG